MNPHSSHFMRLGQPALRWQDASPVGNGLIGGLIFGHPRDELIQTNHGRLYEAPDRTPTPCMTHVLPEVRRLLLAGERDAAFALWESEWLKLVPKPVRVGCYLPAPRIALHTETVGLCTRYMHTLDFSNGVDEVSFCDASDPVRRRVFASRADDTLIIELNMTRPTDVELSVLSGSPDDGELVCERRESGLLFSMRCELYSLSGALRLLASDGRAVWEGDCCALEGATHALFAYSLDAVDTSAESLYARLCQLPADFERLLERHVALHAPLMEQVQFSVNDAPSCNDTNEHLLESLDDPAAMNALMMRLFHFGRYLLISSCRPCAMPPNLQGIWNGDRRPIWGSDFHNDVNIQMNYWQAPMGGLTDMMLAMFDYYDSLLPDFRENARQLFGCRGILMCVSQTLCGLAPSHSPLWVTWTGGAAWIAQHYFDYWRYTGDEDFLRERCLPFLREVADFYEDFIDFSGETALFVPSMSPENIPTDGQRTMLAVNATMDVALARELFTNIIAGCEQVGMWLEDVPRWKSYLDKLPPYEVDPETGALREWLYPGLSENHSHRHESHLYGLFPGEEIDADHPFVDACRTSLTLRRVAGLNQQTGWSLGNMSCVWTRLGDGDSAFDALEVLARSCVGPNLFTYHNDWRSQGNTMFWGHPHLAKGSAWGGNHPPFQIDANLCFPAAVMNMLLQVHGSTVSVLPALPSQWKRGSVSGLKLPGGASADIRWADGKASVVLHGSAAARYTVVSPLPLEVTTC